VCVISKNDERRAHRISLQPRLVTQSVRLRFPDQTSAHAQLAPPRPCDWCSLHSSTRRRGFVGRICEDDGTDQPFLVDFAEASERADRGEDWFRPDQLRPSDDLERASWEAVQRTRRGGE